jgi:glycosyltransferase involved in cell wall biosynthesis
MKLLKPFFSIITCTLNSENYLSKNLDSVEKQTFKDCEQIIIDGESTDNTVEIVKKSSKNNSKIKLFSYPPKGISNAFNLGIKHARGKYIMFLNSDDYFHDDKVLQDSYRFLTTHDSLDWIYGKIDVVEENGRLVGVFPTKKIFQISSNFILKFINFIPHQAVFIKKDVFEKYGGFDTSLKVNMDTDLWLRIAPKTNWNFFDRIVSNYTLRSDSLTSDIRNRDIGLKTLRKVKARYLNRFELFFAKIGDWLTGKYNKTYR